MSLVFRLVAAFACGMTGLAYPGASIAEVPAFSPAEGVALQRGEAIRRDGPPGFPGREGGFGGTFFIRTRASPERVIAAATEWRRYPRFFSRVKDCEQVETAGDREIVRFRVEAIFFRLEYYVANTVDHAGHTVRWELDLGRRNDLRFNSGFLHAAPAPDLGGTLVTYEIKADISRPFFLPAFLKRFYMRREVFRALGELAKEAEAGG